jgi:hypothetical protein
MTSFTNLLNPTFLLFLGILLLVVCLLVIYYESKMREQNHKMTSMLSLISSLAEEVNSVKINLHHFIVSGGAVRNTNLNNINSVIENNQLISVSDDETESDNEDDNEEDSDSENSSDNEEDSDSESEINDDNSDKLIEEDNLYLEEQNNSNSFDNIKSLQISMNDGNENEIYDLNSEKKEMNEINLENDLEEINNIEDDLEALNNNFEDISSSLDFKKINITIDEEQSIDFKKMEVSKLRNIVTEKGLSNDASKLKKKDLLKLLGIE